ncbi:MAG: insulinase family protein [Candidatus Portnoybacteria bacterium]|nr:insulinase family protein [Candidatus Portnoybacteria bacterium]
MGFLVHTGAEQDPVGLEGLSHFIEHSVSENATVPKKDMDAFFEDCGGMVDFGTTDYSYTRYRFFVPIDKPILARAFSMFGHMLLSAELKKFIERERQVIIGEFHRHYPVKPKLDLAMRERKALYSGFWLERFVRPLGNLKSVRRITQRELQAHYDTHYTPANMSIVGVGGMQLQELVELISESPFAKSKKGLRTLLPIPATDLALPSETRYVFEISKHINTPLEVGAYRSVAKIPGNINDQVIHILREMFDKVLNEEVRERRAWAYAIDSSQHNFRHFYEFSINCGALALKALDDIEEVIEVRIASIEDREDLFERVKRRRLASNFMIDPTGKGVCDGALDDLADHHRIISLAEIGEDKERVTMDDVRNALQWLRPERRWTLITRP